MNGLSGKFGRPDLKTMSQHFPTSALLATALLSVISAWLMSRLIVRTADRHLRFTGDHCESSHHKLHSGSVPRVGGLSIVAGMFVALVGLGFAEPAWGAWMFGLYACLLPIFIAGFIEDLTGKVSPRERFLAAAISGVCFFLWFDSGIAAVGIAVIDKFLAYPVICGALTIFCLAGISHAFNLIDGQHGLCAGVSAICAANFAYVSWATGQYALAWVCLALAGANLGFLLVNYPSGKIFLGDGGAYLNGALLGMLGILLLNGSDGRVSPWYGVAVVIYPLWETLFSVWRRKSAGQKITEPDTEHLHSLWSKLDQFHANLFQRSSAPRIWLSLVPTTALSMIGFENTPLMIGAILIFIGIYRYQYAHACLISTRHAKPADSLK